MRTTAQVLRRGLTNSQCRTSHSSVLETSTLADFFTHYCPCRTWMVLSELRLNLTVVIPTRNRAEAVRRLVKQLKDLNWEIIVVDDCSEQPVDVNGARIIRNTQRLGSGESRNAGGKQAEHDSLLFLDDDLVPSLGLTRFIDQLLPRLRTKDVVGFRIVGSNAIGSS